MSRRRATFSPDEMNARNIEIAARPPTISAQAKDDARAMQVFSGFFPTEAAELARAARMVRRIAPPADVEVILDVLGLSEAS